MQQLPIFPPSRPPGGAVAGLQPSHWVLPVIDHEKELKALKETQQVAA
jgi:hypothetical protein